MLRPGIDRLDYSKLLTPPDGFVLDQAIGTTYSLDFDTLIGACLALGLSVETDSALMKDPIYLLNTLREAGDKITIFCQAGQIRLPRNLSPLYILLEKVVFQIQLKKTAKNRHPSFHPKVWLIKYRNSAGQNHYRLIVLSRNLTTDRSWDVAVALDGEAVSESVTSSQPIANFLAFLGKFINGNDTNTKRKRSALRKLSSEIKLVQFKLEHRAFEAFEFIPVGTSDDNNQTYSLTHTPLYSTNFQELLIMSPFISGAIISDFNKRATRHKDAKCLLVTRRQSLACLTPGQYDKFDIYTLKDQVIDGELLISEDSSESLSQDIHAKIYLWKRYSNSELYLGSMNATHSAVSGNVEAVLRLVSRNRWLNLSKLTDDLFGGSPDSPENPFEKVEFFEAGNDTEDFMTETEKVIRNILSSPIRASLEQTGATYHVTLKFKKIPLSEDVTISPLLVHCPAKLAKTIVFENLKLLELSEFYIVAVKRGDITVQRVIKVPTDNMPLTREKSIVTDIIKDTSRFFQYLAFLLGDDYLMSALEYSLLQQDFLTPGGQQVVLPSLYEKLLKTAAQSPERFSEIEYVINMVDDDGIIPDNFIELFHYFRKAVGIK